jgi:hypothetical protein
LPDQALADRQPLGMPVPAVVCIGRQQLQARLLLVLDQVDDAVLRIDQRRQLRQQHAADDAEVALALQHVGEARQVGLQPVLLGVAVGGQPQVVDHGVDVVL